MSIGYMLRMSGMETIGRKVEVGDRVRHHGTKMFATVTKVIPQHDGTSELEVIPFPVRYESLSYHRKFGSPDHKSPCPACTDTTLCENGLWSKANDEGPRGWATYHLDIHNRPEEIKMMADEHGPENCGRCRNPQDYIDKKPCTKKTDLMAEYEHTKTAVAEALVRHAAEAAAASAAEEKERVAREAAERGRQAEENYRRHSPDPYNPLSPDMPWPRSYEPFHRFPTRRR